MQQQNQQEQFKVAPIISEQKISQLKYNIIQTISGYSSQILQSYFLIGWAMVLPIITFSVPLLVSNYLAAIIIPTLVNSIVNLILCWMIKKQVVKFWQFLCKNIFLGIFTFLWANHIYSITQYQHNNIFLLIISAASIISSINTIAINSVKQFGEYGMDNNQMGWDSTLNMRWFIAFPTLLSQFIIDNSGIEHSSFALTSLRIVTSFVFLTWWFGWISSIKNSLYFVLNKIGMFVLGCDSQINLKHAVVSLFLNMIPIAVHEGIYYQTNVNSLTPLIIGASLTSTLTYFWLTLNSKQMTILINTTGRLCLSLINEIIFCVLLCLVYYFGNMSVMHIPIFLGIDVGLYIMFNLMKQLVKGWSRFGYSCNFQCVLYSYIAIAQRTLLRISSGLCVLIIINNYWIDFSKQFIFESNIMAYIIFPFLGYRSFKRCISQTTSFSLHLSLLLCLFTINSNSFNSGCILVLMMPPFPVNPYMAVISIFNIPPKAQHSNQGLLKILYILLTWMGLLVHLLSFGIFQLTMIFGLPIYFPIIPTQTEGYQVRSAQNSLYQKIIQNLDSSIFRYYQVGFYLLRIQKYIILLQVKSSCFGYCQLIDFRGLEVQQVTSCHSKEGQTIDRLASETWGDNKVKCNLAPFYTAIAPYSMKKVYVPAQNDIQLTGVIESKQFVTMFKEIVLKSIIREYSKIMLTADQKKQAEVILGQFSALYKKEAAESLFPHQFAKSVNINAVYPVASGKKKLPPLNKKNGKKNEVINDFLDLVQSSEPINQNSLTTLNDKQKDKQNMTDSKKQQKLDEINMAVILTLYYYSMGKLDYVNTQKLYKLIKRQNETITQIQFDGFEKILSLAMGAAFKISIDKYISGQFQQSKLQDFQTYDTDGFLGTSDSQQFKNAILNDILDIWTINYSKKCISIKRMAKTMTNMYIFKVDEVILKSVWNNLRFQLIYATNDNDQRYSIQTHPTLLRNLWVQACEQPFGYPSYHSGLIVNK